MKCLDLTLPGASANLACDEALLEACEDSPEEETLRFWEPRHYFVVLGYANRAALEVNVAACREEETLRFWEPRHYFVVLGRANRAALEFNVAACREEETLRFWEPRHYFVV